MGHNNGCGRGGSAAGVGKQQYSGAGYSGGDPAYSKPAIRKAAVVDRRGVGQENAGTTEDTDVGEGTSGGTGK